MAFSISKIILHNRAPFDHIEMNFMEKGITLVSALNGGGKTTVLSHIADAWYEMVRIAFPLEYEGKQDKYYRISSVNFNLDKRKASIVYIRFFDGIKIIDYVDARTPCSQTDYDNIVLLKDKIPYDRIKSSLDKSSNVKYVSEQNQEKLQGIFVTEVVTYFPAYRHEQPGYLNSPFDTKVDYNLSPFFSGHLKNPIEFITGLHDLANWLMDIVLDMYLGNDDTTTNLFNNINEIFTQSLRLKTGKDVFLGIGTRNNGVTRIQVGERENDHQSGEWKKSVYPSIFNMSSGENAIVCLFLEIAHQFDRIMPNTPLSAAEGIILIDEADKHLHIRLQTEVLPKLFYLFPNTQFIISSHSPFIPMGLYNNDNTRSRLSIIDLDENGTSVDVMSTQVFKEAYDSIIEEDRRYKKLYDAILERKQSEKLQIISEGKNFEHIKRAIELIEPSLLGKVDFPYSDKTGKQQLKHAFDVLGHVSVGTKCLFVWDCDNKSSCDSLSETELLFKFVFEKNEANTKVINGIENLYPQDLFTEAIYTCIVTSRNDGGKKTESVLDKNMFIEQIKRDEDLTHFINFHQLILKIRNIIGDT